MLTSFHAKAQDVLVWEGRGDSFSNQILNVNQGYLLPERENMWSDAYYTIVENRIYEGFSSSFFDLKFTVRDGQLFMGDSQFRGDILYTLKNGQIFTGDSDLLMDVLFTFKRGQLFEGSGMSSFDVLYTIDGNPTAAELYAIIIALGLLN